MSELGGVRWSGLGLPDTLRRVFRKTVLRTPEGSELIRLVIFGLPVIVIYGVWVCPYVTVARM
jgi:hypothetical protein